jgi:hypothetical protein
MTFAGGDAMTGEPLLCAEGDEGPATPGASDIFGALPSLQIRPIFRHKFYLEPLVLLLVELISWQVER